MNFGFFQKDNTNIEDVRKEVLKKFPLLGATMSDIKTKATNAIPTASTDGETIYYSPKFFNTLSNEEKVFAYSHEVMHIAFDHIMRSKGKDPQLWNIATDSVINQMLKQENLPIIKNCVDMEDAINKSAEEMYNKLLKEQEQNKQSNGGNNQKEQQTSQQQQQQNQQQQQSKQQVQQQANQQQEQQDNQQQEQSNNNCSGSQEQNSQRTSQQQKVYDEQIKKQQEKNGQSGHDDHTMWEEAVKKAEKNQKKGKQKNQNNLNEDKQKDLPNEESEQNETNEQKEEKTQDNDGELEANQQNKNKKEENTEDNLQKHPNDFYNKVEQHFNKMNKRKKQEILEKLRKQRRPEHQGNDGPAGKGEIGGEQFCFEKKQIGTAKPLITWKKILRREFEKEEDRWCYRRATEDNDFCARIGAVEAYEKPSTEVLLDTSGSIDDRLLRGFLRQLKPLLKESKLFVGCFDDRFYGFSEITSNKDIDDFIFRGRGGTSFDTAIRSFSKDKKINKIIFTDGEDRITSIPDEIKKSKIYWLVFEKREFKPGVGKVIYVDKNQVRNSTQNERAL